VKVLQIVRERIIAEGLDGLCDVETGCGCGLDDLAPCELGPYPDCQLAVKIIVPPEGDPAGQYGNACDYAKPGDEIFVLAEVPSDKR
jgi:hypothetical protein